MKRLFLIAALTCFTLAGSIAYTFIPSSVSATNLNTCQVQILDQQNNELTDPNNRPVFSGGYAFVEVPSHSFYRLRFVNCGTLPCSGTQTARLYGFIPNDVNFVTNGGIASGASGVYLYTLFPNDPGATVSFTVRGFRE